MKPLIAVEDLAIQRWPVWNVYHQSVEAMVRYQKGDKNGVIKPPEIGGGIPSGPQPVSPICVLGQCIGATQKQEADKPQ